MKDKTPRALSFIPIDLITMEILPRLPAKTLVRFSAVCKSWYSLIRNPDFVNANLRLNLSKPIIPCFLYTIDCVRGRSIVSENQNGGKPVFHKLGFEHRILRLIGSCKGLISLSIRTDFGEGIILFNPSIRMFKFVDNLPLYSSSDYLYRFGYDVQSNDHKLLKFTCNKMQKAEVYSLTTGSWREIQQVPPRMLKFSCKFKSGFYLNGATYWLTINRASIVSFDFNQEVFREVKLPREPLVNDFPLIYISEFEGSLALLVYTQEFRTFYFWVLRGDGVEESSWNKITYQHGFPVGYVPRALLRGGTVVLWKPSGMGYTEFETVFYAIENRQVKDFGWFGGLYCIDDFTDSLLLLGNGQRSVLL